MKDLDLVDEIHKRILAKLKELKFSDDTGEGFLHFDEQEINESLQRYDDLIRQLMESSHKRWKDNLNAGKGVLNKAD